ncbi:hypothetical protein FKM82_019688, partial [Ascaphus truei]
PFAEKINETTDPDKKQMLEKILSAVTAAVRPLEESLSQTGRDEEIQKHAQILLEEAADLLSEWLDTKHGAQVMDNSIFSQLPKYWEGDYHTDMDSLN